MAYAGNKITIAYVIDFLASNDGLCGGTERQLIETVARLDRRSFRPIVICLRDFPRIPQWLELDCEKHILHINSLASIKTIQAIFRFAEFFRGKSVDIVQTFFHDSTLIGVLAGRIAGVKKVVSCRRDLGFWYNKRILASLSIANAFTDRILCNCTAVKDSVVRCERFPRDKIDVIYNGIDMDNIAREPAIDLCYKYQEINNGDRIVGMVANFNRPVKRVDLFVRAAGEVCKERQGVKFVLIGGGNQENKLQQSALELGIKDRLIFAGKKDSAIGYIKSFDVGVVTSDSEGLSNTVLEYMAAGVPVVTTNVGGNTELISHNYNGILAQCGDFNSIAVGILSLLDNPLQREYFIDKSKLLIEKKYSWNARIIEIEDYYMSISNY